MKPPRLVNPWNPSINAGAGLPTGFAVPVLETGSPGPNMTGAGLSSPGHIRTGVSLRVLAVGERVNPRLPGANPEPRFAFRVPA